MRFFIDGRIDIRPLAAQDKSHVPLPYDLVPIQANWGPSGTIADGINSKIIFTDADWGSGLDYYPLQFTFGLSNTAEYMTASFEGFLLTIVEDPISGSAPALFIKSYERAQIAIVQSGLLDYIAWVTEVLEGNKINNDSDLDITFYNRTGVTFNKANINIYILGIAI